jgi:hypothetical protein
MDGDSRGGSVPGWFLPTEVQQTFLEPLSAASNAERISTLALSQA